MEANLNILLLAITVLIILLYALIDILLSGKILVIKNLAIGAAYYICAFVIISQIAFALDVYRLFFVYTILIIFASVALLAIYLRKYKSKDALRQIEVQKYVPICLIVILVIGFLFSFLKFEMFGMGQDQGVYQTVALLMVDGFDSRVVPIKEYDLLTDNEDIQTFLGAMNREYLSGLGFYPIERNEIQGLITPGTYPVNSAVFHGLQNLPALLSVTGKIFGAENLMHGLTLPYLISLVLIFKTLNMHLGFNKWTASIATLLFALSPVVLWTSKASLTEVYLAMFMSLFAYYLTGKDKILSWLLWIPVTAFAFLHVSIYLIMPMFIALFIGLALYRRDKGVLFSGFMSVVLYAIGFLVMSFSSPLYTTRNYRWLFGLINRIWYSIGLYDALNGFIFELRNVQFVFIFIFCGIALGLLFCVYYFFIRKERSAPNIKPILSTILRITSALCIPVFIYQWYIIARVPPVNTLIHNHFRGGGFTTTIPNTRVFAYAFAIGFFLLAIIAIKMMIGDKTLLKADTLPLTFIFTYTVLILSLTVAVDVPYYYYFSRYAVPYIPIIVILGGVSISRFKVGWQVTVAALSLVIVLPFSTSLALNKDISAMEIKSQREVMDIVSGFDPGSVVLLEWDINRFFYNSISYNTENYALPSYLIEMFNDKSFFSDRDIYYIYPAGEVSSTSDHHSYAQVRSLRSRYHYWMTGWNPGPRSLLQPDKGEYWIVIEKYETVDDLFDLVGT